MTDDDAPGFLSMPARLGGEREERLALGARRLYYHVPFLDDVLRGIFPHDLILIGAPSGHGKTELVNSIATANALKERRVAVFALEAEPRELERRAKFGWISTEAHLRRIPRRGELNYTDWLAGECEDIVGELDREADRWFLSSLSTLRTFYRGQSFDADDLAKAIEREHRVCDLIIVDHLHYIDVDDSKGEASAYGEVVKTIRDVSLRVGRPVILVAHLRKRDPRMKQLVAQLDDFHGSSNISKICTQAITIERANVVEAKSWYLAPTFVSVLKDRRSGAPPFVALTEFDRRTKRYADTYTLGRLTKGGTDWEELKPNDRPGWANGHRQLDMKLEGES